MADSAAERSILGAVTEVGGLSPEVQEKMREMGLDPSDEADRKYFGAVQGAQHAVGAAPEAPPTNYVTNAEKGQLPLAEKSEKHTPGAINRYSPKETKYLKDILSGPSKS